MLIDMENTFLQHPDVIKYAFGLMLTVISGYTAFTLTNINNAIANLYNRVLSIEKDLYTLKGSHDANHSTEKI